MGVALVIVLIATAFVTSAPSWAFRGLIGLVVVLTIFGLALAAMTLLSRYRRRTQPERGRPRAGLVERRADPVRQRRPRPRLRPAHLPRPEARRASRSAPRSSPGSRRSPASTGRSTRSASARACRPRRSSSSSRRWSSSSRSSRATSARSSCAVAYPLARPTTSTPGRAIAFSIGLQIIEAALATGPRIRLPLARRPLTCRGSSSACTRVGRCRFDRVYAGIRFQRIEIDFAKGLLRSAEIASTHPLQRVSNGTRNAPAGTDVAGESAKEAACPFA